MRRTNLFRLFILCLVSAAALSLYGADPASAKSVRASFVNHSGHVIKYLYMSSHGDNSWGNDLLGSSSVLGNGESTTFTYNNNFNRYIRYCDIKVIFGNDDYVTFWNVDLKGLWRITLFWNYGSTYTIQRN